MLNHITKKEFQRRTQQAEYVLEDPDSYQLLISCPPDRPDTLEILATTVPVPSNWSDSLRNNLLPVFITYSYGALVNGNIEEFVLTYADRNWLLLKSRANIHEEFNRRRPPVRDLILAVPREGLSTRVCWVGAYNGKTGPLVAVFYKEPRIPEDDSVLTTNSHILAGLCPLDVFNAWFNMGLIAIHNTPKTITKFNMTAIWDDNNILRPAYFVVQ